MGKLLIKGNNIYTGNRIIDSGFILIDSGTIIHIGTESEISNLDLSGLEVVELTNSYSIIPGMIDMHIHGAAGADIMDGTRMALEKIAKVLPKEGTTSFLATTLTESEELIKLALKNVGENIKNLPVGCAEILGVHLEGPFISPERPGAQSKGDILMPDIEKFREFQEASRNSILQVTMAPEQPGGLELVTHLSSIGIVVSIGHSNATAEEMDKAVIAGASQVTHLFNAMSPIHHRDPGVAGSALIHDELLCELISDGIHIHPNMVKMAFKIKGKEGLILVTDAIRAKCLGKGFYSLGKQKISVQNGRAFLENGTLAGSILTMKDSIKNTIKFTSCSLEDIVFMTAVNPAKQLNLLRRIGSLDIDKDADIVVLDEFMDVYMTFCKGNLAYTRKTAANS